MDNRAGNDDRDYAHGDITLEYARKMIVDGLVTPQMIDAGTDVLMGTYIEDDPWEEIVVEIYRVMVQANLLTIDPTVSLNADSSGATGRPFSESGS